MRREDLKGGARYRNLKTGYTYRFIRLAFYTEADIEMVVYEDPDGQTWVRPLEDEHHGFLVKFEPEDCSNCGVILIPLDESGPKRCSFCHEEQT